MDVSNIDADISIGHIVEAMLPRSSDSKLGLYIPVQLDFSDYGYAKDGNTLEREPLHVRSIVHFLFVRPSNYTQVYVTITEQRSQRHVLNGKEPHEWQQTSNHDSCWRSDGFRPLTEEYFRLTGMFTDREVSGVKMRPIDVHGLSCIDRDPTYVEVDIKSANPNADRYSKESRQVLIDMKAIARHRLEQIGYKDERYGIGSKPWMADITSGVLIKGSETHKMMLDVKKRCDEKYGENA